MKPAYYSEFDKRAAAWLRELIREGLIAPGDVDERDLWDVKPNDLKGYGQKHFCAGIGGWSFALRQAGVSDDADDIWTISCPCQPFSEAGAGRGFDDDRHLWPAFYWHIANAIRPPKFVFGEQVDAAIRHGWLDLVRDDLEAQNYAFASICLPAACVGAPHIRQRLWWVAYGNSRRESAASLAGLHNLEHYVESRRSDDPLADSSSTRLEVERQQQARGEREAAERGSAPGGLADDQAKRCGEGWPDGSSADGAQESGRSCNVGPLGHTDDGRGGRDAGAVPGAQGGAGWSVRGVADGIEPAGNAGLTGFWRRADRIVCRDGKARPVEPGIFPLVDGFPNRVGLLRGAGNAIVPQVAAAFVEETFLTLPSIHRIL